MRILVMADEESKSLYTHFDKKKFENIDLMIACGDLSKRYLEFFATVVPVPLLYVRGNHDQRLVDGVGGGICIEDDVYVYKGVRILGLGGSMCYIPGRSDQYTEKQMLNRIKRMRWKLKRTKGFDILVAHAPAFGLNDMEDLPHQGFECFKALMQRYKPKYFLHGHIHENYGDYFKREDKYLDTTIINGYDHYIIEYPDQEIV